MTVENVMVTDLTLALGTTIANYIYALEQAQAGAGVAFLRNNGFMLKDYYAYNAGSLESVLTSGHRTVGFNQWDEVWEVGNIDPTTGSLIASTTNIRSKNLIPVIPNTTYYAGWGAYFGRVFFYDANQNYISYVGDIGHEEFVTPSGCQYIRFRMYSAYGTTYNHDICINLSSDRNGEYEPYSEHLYPLSPVSLRGIMTLVDGKLQNDGDEYLPDGTVKRNWAERDYQEGDASDGSTMITNGIKTVYKLTTPTTETTDPYQSEQTCSEYGTEAFIDERDVPIPVGHVTEYWPDLVEKIESLTDALSIVDGAINITYVKEI